MYLQFAGQPALQILIKANKIPKAKSEIYISEYLFIC
jgi:hypothetical protein